MLIMAPVLRLIFLTFFGLMMVYSSSVYISNRYYDNGYKYLIKQFGFAMVGFLIMFLVSRVRYQVFKKFIYLFIIALKHIPACACR